MAAKTSRSKNESAATNAYDVRSALQRLAGALLDDVERIAPRSVARMQELLPSYAKVPADALIPVTLTNTRNILEAVRDPEAGHSRDDEHFRVSGQTRLSQGITADEMLQAWRIGLEVVREEAHAVARRLGVTDDVLLEFVEATLRWGDIGMRRSAAAHRLGEIRELERLAAEQAALRRVAMMIARESSPKEVFAKVAEELSRLIGVDNVRMVRFEPQDAVTVVAARMTSEELLPVGVTVPIPKGSVIDRVFRTGEPARVEDYSEVEGPIGDAMRREHVRWGVGGPIVVDGRLWGAMVVGSSMPEGSSETEKHVAEFSELVSTAISNVESRERVERLAAEQAALRRVAELIARQAPSEQVFAVVTEELSGLMEVNIVRMVRFEPDGTATVVAAHGVDDGRMTRGENFPIPEGSVAEKVFRTGRPARVDDFAEVKGPIGAILREQGAGAGVGGPIVVEGRLWGAMAIGVRSAEALPVGTEDRVAQFAELVSTAISNLESRAKVEQLAAEQAALRRVAEFVARQAAPEQVFARVTEELNRLLDVTSVGTVRFEPDGTATVMAVRGAAQDALPPGTSVRLTRGSMIEQVFRTGRPAHLESYENVGGQPGPLRRELAAGWAAAGPIVVDGRLWGAMVANSLSAGSYPPEAEQRVAQFAELVSTAISNIESRAKVERLAAEQSALRRVATLVAREHSPEDLFATLVEELGVLLQVDATAILRYEGDSSARVLAGWSDGAIMLPVGERFVLDGENLAGQVHRTGLPSRKQDYGGASGEIAATVRELGVQSAVASPIVVEGATWGVIAVLSREPDGLPSDTEARIAEFTRQAALAVANAKSRADLAESRARIVRAGDEARRRFERDLHDGAQQRLVSLGLELRAVETTAPPELGDLRGRLSRLVSGLNGVLDDLRELSRGLHPAVLSEDGLSPALSSLALRSAVPVDLRLDLGTERFEEPIEVAAYYVACEALTNTAKHAGASQARVTARRRGGWLELMVSDDGRGGADASHGSGLTGLIDRVEAIGGSIHIHSTAGLGTAIHAKLPIKPAPA
jgi:GAF domain-containing protein